MVNITYIEKDIVLNWLCTNSEYSSGDILQKIDFDSLRKILFYFVKKGLIEPTDIRKSQPNYYIHVNVEAYDLFNHNGFTGIEFLLEENLRKLQLELKELQSTLPEKVNTISEIVSAITSTLTLWFNR